MSGLDDVTREFCTLFERLDIPYAIMGGVAARVHSLPRPTFDVDFTASIERSALPVLAKEAELIGCTAPPSQATGWIDSVRGMPVVKYQWHTSAGSVDVDIFLAETEYQKVLLSRRQRLTLDGRESWFVTAEDLVLLKLMANRPKDRIDVSDLLFVQGQLDEAYLHEWADKLKILPLLTTVLKEGPR